MLHAGLGKGVLMLVIFLWVGTQVPPERSWHCNEFMIDVDFRGPPETRR